MAFLVFGVRLSNSSVVQIFRFKQAMFRPETGTAT